ncbi:MAG: hypothetical protein AABW89_04815 [Nanoarchaeota archaeon]
MNKLIFIGIFALLSLGVFVIAQVLTGEGVVVNAYNCTETDGGLNYLVAGSMNGFFWWNSTNGSQSFTGTVSDVCISNTTLIESVCGSSISSSYSGLAGALNVDCAINTGNNTNYTGLCGQSRCY